MSAELPTAAQARKALDDRLDEVGQVPCMAYPDLWFNQKSTGDTEKAVEMCQPCPARSECAIYALVSGKRYGVWGGLSSPDNHALPAAARPRSMYL